MSAITTVRMAPNYVEGIINLRGRITPIVDLRARFGRLRVEHTKATRIVVVSMEGRWVGLVVDGVSEVTRIRPDDVEKAGDLITTVDSELIRGIAKMNEHLVILLTLDRLLAGCGSVPAAAWLSFSSPPTVVR